MTTIDHAAEARRTVEIAAMSYGQIDTRNGDMAVAQQIEAQVQAQVAQVHATLALVEQQRIANIIALSVPQQPPGSDKDTSVLIPSFDKEFNLRDDIKKGLGL